MLVLSRKSCESVVIGSPEGAQKVLRVTVLEVRGRRVRLGIEADAGVRIQRAECRLGTDGSRTLAGALAESHR